MNKCTSVLDFFCCPIKSFFKKCFIKAKPTTEPNNSKIIVEEIDRDVQIDHDSLEEINEIREIFIDSSISESEFNKPQEIPNLKLKNLVKKDSLSDFIDNNYLNNDLNNKTNYGSNSCSEIIVNTD